MLFVDFFKGKLPLIIKVVTMAYRGYLVETGWVKSYKNKMPLDSAGEPVPWVTLPFIRFIENRINNKIRLFEYGSGNSTFYYAKRVKEVVSIEHDNEWVEIVKRGKPVNAHIVHIELTDECDYQKAILKHGKFDMVIVDGRRRNDCIHNSIDSLSEIGVIVLDDSHRDEYKSGIDYLKNNGFKCIDFYGVAPGQSWEKCTSIFYKENNCLNI